MGSSPAQPSRNVLWVAIQLVLLLLLLTILTGTLLVIVSIRNLVDAPAQTAGDLSARVSTTLGDAQRALRGITDPNQPPTGLAYDTEFNSLVVWPAGGRLPDSAEYILVLHAIRRRDGAPTQDAGQYAVIHAELRQPREIRLLGQRIWTDSDPHEHVVYKGQAFRIGRVVYRVNWVSQEDAALAGGALRRPDALTTPLAFEYD